MPIRIDYGQRRARSGNWMFYEEQRHPTKTGWMALVYSWHFAAI